jgi:probable F420-dependent oxidoreductase
MTWSEDPALAVRLAKLGDNFGYDFIWVPDSHIIWREAFSYLSLYATHTSRVKLGTAVTNFHTRNPTVVAGSACTINEISNGRMVLGVGRGDSSVRVIGESPVKFEKFKEDVLMVKALCNGQEVDYHGTRVKIPWTRGKIPLYVAAYGPKVLEFAGQVAEGVILQIGEPNVVKWSIKFIRKGAESAGRSIDDLDIVCAAACYISDDLEKARNLVRNFPGVVSNHVFDLMKKYSMTELPPELVKDIEGIRGKYNYLEHGAVGAKHTKFITDRLVDSFTIIGNAEQCSRKIKELEEAGMTNLMLYLPDKADREYLVKTFGEHVIPRFK